MASHIDQLVNMRDVETLYELMTEDDDWLTQLDAAEGLIKLGDRRGYEFVFTATLSDDDEILEAANEIFNSPELAKMRRDIEAQREKERRAGLESAKRRLQQGGRVFRYRMIHLASGALMGDDPLGRGFEVPALDSLGLEGWEVVNILPVRRSMMVGSVDDHFTGAYFLLKREVLPGDSAELGSQ
jgi:hypothetical protein